MFEILTTPSIHTANTLQKALSHSPCQCDNAQPMAAM